MATATDRMLVLNFQQTTLDPGDGRFVVSPVMSGPWLFLQKPGSGVS